MGDRTLENVTIGVCDNCGNRYYSANILYTVHQVVTGEKPGASHFCNE